MKREARIIVPASASRETIDAFEARIVGLAGGFTMYWAAGVWVDPADSARCSEGVYIYDIAIDESEEDLLLEHAEFVRSAANQKAVYVRLPCGEVRFVAERPRAADPTREAILGSIDKWQNIVDSTGTDKSTRNCPLCEKFIQHNCDGCPVMAVSGCIGCRGTPYVEWNNYTCWVKHLLIREMPENYSLALKLAEAELEFLKDVLRWYDEEHFNV